MAVLHLLSVLVLSYLVGSFPSSIVLGKLFFRKDIRDHGSGNAGGTNAVRVFGWPVGLTVILIDAAKGVCAVLCIAQIPAFQSMAEPLLPPDAVALAAGSAAVVGHVWTVFASWKGGKGVATAAGMLAALYPAAFFITLIFFVLAIALTGIVSVGSLTAAVLFPVTRFLLNLADIRPVSPLLLWITVPLSLLIIFTHRKNIGRFIRGDEPRMFGKK